MGRSGQAAGFRTKAQRFVRIERPRVAPPPRYPDEIAGLLQDEFEHPRLKGFEEGVRELLPKSGLEL